MDEKELLRTVPLFSELSGPEHAEDDLAPVVAEDRDLDPAVDDDEEEVALLVLEEDDGVLRVAPARREAAQARDVGVGELGGERHGPEQLFLVHHGLP